LVYFFPFWHFVPKKIWQPWSVVHVIDLLLVELGDNGAALQLPDDLLAFRQEAGLERSGGHLPELVPHFGPQPTVLILDSAANGHHFCASWKVKMAAKNSSGIVRSSFFLKNFMLTKTLLYLRS
jgi:hypothetical protein